MPPTFAELELHADVLRAIDALGFEAPTPIQAQTIPLLLAGRDVLAQAQTGTGKTAAFALPIAQRVDTARREVQALVLAPTRELAIQVSRAMQDLGRTRGLAVLPVYGGQGYDQQLRGLRAGVHVVVGTPGRVMDHIRRGTLDLSTVNTVVLDEADEMLDMGFVEDIEFILGKVPEERQIGLFSATIPKRIDALAQRYQRKPARISIAQEAATAPQTRQMYVETHHREKVQALTRILDLESPSSAIIFCRTKRDVDELFGTLQGRGYTAAAIHGDVTQVQRERLLLAFRDGRVALLIATEVAARGLDIPDVTHVFNYDIPGGADAYIHRIGRTGRMGRKGDAITFVAPSEIRKLRFIERRIRQRLMKMPVPTAADIAARREEMLRSSLVTAIESGSASRYTSLVGTLAKDHDPLQVAAAAIYLANGGPGGRHEEPTAEETPRRGSASEGEVARLHLDAGHSQGVSPSDIVAAFTSEAEVSGREIGAIDIYGDFTLVEVAPAAGTLLLERATLPLRSGRDVQITVAQPKRPPGATARARPPGPRKGHKGAIGGRPSHGHKPRRPTTSGSRAPGAHKRRKPARGAGRPAGVGKRG